MNLKANRSSIHIEGLTVRTAKDGMEIDGIVDNGAETACAAMTRYAMSYVGRSHDTAAAALAAAETLAKNTGRQVCKTCRKAAEAETSAPEAPEQGLPAALSEKEEILRGAESAYRAGMAAFRKEMSVRG